MQTEFTPFLSLGGGALIGLSAVIMMAANGRIAGISGILSQLLSPEKGRTGLVQGIIFIVGLLVATPLYHMASGHPPAQIVSDNLSLLAVAGILVGFGAVLGNGCTSGHGVCGISRLSQRSIIATLTFMATAFVTVYVLRHMVGG